MPIQWLAMSGLALVLVGCARSHPPRWVVNETASLPTGVYRLTSGAAARGAIVTLRPPRDARAYLANLGAGPKARLLKRVVASDGDLACRRGRWLVWPGGAARSLLADRQGRALPQWRGCRTLGRDERLVLGDTPISFDSRYFGPVTTHDIEGTYAEVWTW